MGLFFWLGGPSPEVEVLLSLLNKEKEAMIFRSNRDLDLSGAFNWKYAFVCELSLYLLTQWQRNTPFARPLI